MAREFFTPIDLNNNRLLEAVLTLENVASGSAPNAEAGRIIHDSGTVKYHNGSTWVSLGAAGAGVSDTRQIIAGAGLTGGGDLTTDRTLNVVSANSDMTVAADAITIVSAPKWTTGRTITLSGDVSGSVASVDGSAAINISNMAIGTGVIVDADVNASAAISQSKIATLTTDLSNKLSNASPTVASGDLTLFRDPTNPLHAATKQYVDLTAQGLDFKNSVVAATTGSITLSGTQTVDGVPLLAGNRVLVKDNTGVQNGIYLVAAGAWTRTTDADASGEISEGVLVPVESGTTNGDSLWLCTGAGTPPWVPGTSTSAWTRFSSVTDLIAGNGLSKTGNTLDIGQGTGISVAADSISVVSAPQWTTGRTISLTGDVTGTSGAFDGTGNLSFAATIAAGVIVDADISGSAAIATSKIAGLDAALLAAGKRFSTNVTAGATYVVTHNLNTTDVIVQVYVIATGAQVELDVTRTSVNAVTLAASPSIPAGLRCVVLA